MAPLIICLMPCAGWEYQAVGNPDAEPHFGQVSRPSAAKTRFATAIWVSRDVAAGLPTPPYCFHVGNLNCNPPYSPLPVSAAQFPPDSHCAIASQLGAAGAALATPLGAATDAPMRPATAANLTSGPHSLLMPAMSRGYPETLLARERFEIAHIPTTNTRIGTAYSRITDGRSSASLLIQVGLHAPRNEQELPPVDMNSRLLDVANIGLCHADRTRDHPLGPAGPAGSASSVAVSTGISGSARQDCQGVDPTATQHAMEMVGSRGELS